MKVEKVLDFVKYHKVESSNTSHLEAHAGIYRLLMKGIFNAYVLWPIDKKLIFELVTHVNTRDFTLRKNHKGLNIAKIEGYPKR
jgi:hypothetical protein